MSERQAGSACLLALLGLLIGCGGEGEGPPAEPPVSLLPADYPARFVEVRDCRRSVEHGLINILIMTESVAAQSYLNGPFPLPVGTLVVKQEYALGEGCTERVGTTLMRKEPAGYDPAHGDWRWQKLDVAGKVLLDGRGTGALAACGSCHAGTRCRARDFTCAEP
jgi:hypothetical protein